MPAGKAKEARAFGSPSRYIQGPGEIRNLPRFAANYGKTALLIIDTFFYDTYRETLPALFAEQGMTAYAVEFSGRCCAAMLNELTTYTRTLPEIPDTFIGIGGGQACDINKAVGATFRKAFINVPTALSSDAPTSTHSIFNNDGALFDRMVHYKNPDYVVVDTEIAIQSPLFMFLSGIGDALATYIEAQASYANNNVCNAGGGTYRPTQLGMAAAKLAYDILLEKGRDAVHAAKQHLRTPVYEDVVEATILLSGLGFECTGVSVAHGLQAGFFAMPDAKPMLHGAGVGYGALVQLVLENDQARLAEVFSFCKDVGMPVCTADLGLTPENRNDNIEKLVDEVYDSRWNIHNVPFHVSREMLVNAIYALDTYAAEQM